MPVFLGVSRNERAALAMAFSSSSSRTASKCLLLKLSLRAWSSFGESLNSLKSVFHVSFHEGRRFSEEMEDGGRADERFLVFGAGSEARLEDRARGLVAEVGLLAGLDVDFADFPDCPDMGRPRMPLGMR